jgi:hypothetical protein
MLGAPINPSLVSGLSNPVGIVVIPEPSTIVLAVLGMVVLMAYRRCAVNAFDENR